jgi:hypothetical protein
MLEATLQFPCVVVCCGVLWCVVVCCGVLWCVDVSLRLCAGALRSRVEDKARIGRMVKRIFDYGRVLYLRHAVELLQQLLSREHV